MANTIVFNDILTKAVEKNLYKEFVFAPYCNRNYEGELRQQGETVKVPRFSKLTGTVTDGNVLANAGEDITLQDWAFTTDDLTVNQCFTL